MPSDDMPRTPARPRAGGAAAARRARILEAGLKLFAAMPYAEVHMDAVAAGAGVAKPTLYRYFPTKEALFIEGLAFELAALRQEIGEEIGQQSGREIGEQAGAGDRSAAARLRRAIGIVLERVGRLSPAIEAVEGHGAELGEKSRRTLRVGFRGLREALAAILREGAASGEFAPVNEELAVLMIVGGVRMAALAARRPVAPDELARLLLDGLRSPAGVIGAPQTSAQDNLVSATSGPRRPILGAVA